MCATAPTALGLATKLVLQLEAEISSLKGALSCWDKYDDGPPRTLRSAVVGVPVGGAWADAGPDRRCHDIPASTSDSSRAGPAPEHQPLVSILAVAHHRHGDEGVGGSPPQASRPMRNAAGSAQPADPRHRASAVGRRVSLRARSARPRAGRTIRPRHAERLDR